MAGWRAWVGRLGLAGAAASLAALASGTGARAGRPVPAPRLIRQMERLGRGIVAVRTAEGRVWIAWRLLRTDPDSVTFNLYRSSGGEAPVRVNTRPIAGATHSIDPSAASGQPHVYTVRPVLDGREQAASAPFRLASDAANGYLTLPLRTPAAYTPNDASPGDLDGDGEYEIVLHQVGRGRDNSQAGTTTEPILQAYRLDGTLLWTISLGKNIREGAHYTQFMVYDLDGDGRAEVACKTADGTVDGTGKVIGDPTADHQNARGYILSGPEFLTVFDGRTGAALATASYIPPRGGDGSGWGDNYGNRVDRFLACVAYLDGERPSLVMARGYYTRSVLAAWDWRGGRLRHRWTFDSDAGPQSNRAYRGQGNHNLSVGDVDGDGRDEIVYGQCTIDDDGKGLYSTGIGHGDAMHLTDLDPDRQGLEVFSIQERFGDAGASFRDARTGAVLWKKPSVRAGADGEGPGRGLAMDIDPRHRGSECWVKGAGIEGLFNTKGDTISERAPGSCNFGVWWDGDVLRELLDGITISKWEWETGAERALLTAEGCAANNGTKSTPALSADLLGDWREEVVWRTTDNRSLRIYTTTVPTGQRLHTLMHDPHYRLSVAWQNVGYNQPPHTGFHLGAGMKRPPRPRIRPAGSAQP